MAPLRSPKQPLAIRGGFGKTLKRPRTPTITSPGQHVLALAHPEIIETCLMSSKPVQVTRAFENIFMFWSRQDQKLNSNPDMPAALRHFLLLCAVMSSCKAVGNLPFNDAFHEIYNWEIPSSDLGDIYSSSVTDQPVYLDYAFSAPSIATNQEAQARALTASRGLVRTLPEKFEPGPSNILHGSRDNVKIPAIPKRPTGVASQSAEREGQKDVLNLTPEVVRLQPKKIKLGRGPVNPLVTNAAEAVPERDPTSKTGETSKEADGWAWSLTGTGLSQAIDRTRPQSESHEGALTDRSAGSDYVITQGADSDSSRDTNQYSQSRPVAKSRPPRRPIKRRTRLLKSLLA
ncbi:hypothetical protein H4Q26_006917 [Puccinia striiformis f. sp. tritici PST-130]|nr:hypothetical protein H4Q26_006917 [Puccinia striiformis f. sp. tritici PST-130]